MGGPKALLTVDGNVWWRVQRDRIAASGRGAVWVVSPEVREGMGEGASSMALVDADPDAPMFASVRAGLVRLASSPPACVHVLPIDVPAPRSGTFDALERATEAAKGGVAAPRHRAARGHPLCLAWMWIARVALPCADSDARLDELTAHDRVLVDVDDADVTANLNTPDDLRAWLNRR